MKEKLTKFKHFVLTRDGNATNIYFDTRFTKSGFWAWRAEKDVLTLIEKDDQDNKNSIELKYNSEFTKFLGKQGDSIIEVAPLSTNALEFSRSMEIKREIKIEPLKEQPKTKKFAVISKQLMREFDVYQYRSGLAKSMLNLFNRGYETIVFSQGLDSDQINKLSGAKDVTYYYDDYRKLWGFSITREFWERLGQLNGNYNFFKNLDDRLKELRVKPNYIEETNARTN